MRLHAELLSGTALSSVVIVLALGLSRPALADGGTGGPGTGSFIGTGTGGPGGAGAAGYSGQAGSDGQDGTGDYGGGGGGGGAAGGGAGGAGGLDGSGAASGGAGGTGGTNGATGITSVSVGVTVSGGSGGSGGASLTSASGLGGGGAGGGGAGGYGVIETTALTLTNNGTISGGAGGNGGGTGGGLGTNGANGDGGVGVLFTVGGMLKNYGSIHGGSTTSATGGTAVVGSNLTILNAGTISGGNGTSSKAIDFVSGSNFLQLLSGSFINGNVAIEAGATLTIDQRSAGVDASFGIPYTTDITGSGTLIVDAGAHTLTLNSASSFSGAVNLASGTTALANAGALGSGTVSLTGGTTGSTLLGQFDGTLSNAINISAGNSATIGAASGKTMTLGGSFTYNGGAGTTLTFGSASATGTVVFAPSSATFNSGGALSVDGGTLSVNGSIASAGVLTVNSGGTVGGTGTLSSTVIASGGTLAPGNSIGTITVSGNLTFNSGSTYAVEVSPSAADRTNVTGSASLAGTVNATFASGHYVGRSYTILSATGGLGGTTFDTLTTSGLPANFTARLSYDTTDVLLNLTAALGVQGGFSSNQQNVANALDGYFNNGGTLPPGFVTIFGLSGDNLKTALTQLSGEAATGGQQGAFQMMTFFLDRMTDPFLDGRGGEEAGSHALGYAAEGKTLPSEVTSAYASAMRAPAKTTAFDKRWSLWGSAYGATNRTGGDLNGTGSNDLSARVNGFAAGADYRVTPSTMLGFAFAGGETSWSLAQGLGSGRSDAFQAGVYGKTRFGPAYIAASLAYAEHWMSTDRTAYASDHLTASFNAHSYGGRIETGYRFAALPVAVTPYAAAQAQALVTPSYNENDVTGGGYALAYAGRTATDTRGEVGARFDRTVALDSAAALTLRAKLAYAHDWVSDPSLNATFQALPGASFIVNGATPAHDSGLVSAGADLRLANGFVLGVKFDEEFSAHAQTYAGTATLRYLW